MCVVVAVAGEDQEGLGDILAGAEDMLKHGVAVDGIGNGGIAKDHESGVLAQKRIRYLAEESGVGGRHGWWCMAGNKCRKEEKDVAAVWAK